MQTFRPEPEVLDFVKAAADFFRQHSLLLELTCRHLACAKDEPARIQLAHLLENNLFTSNNDPPYDETNGEKIRHYFVKTLVALGAFLARDMLDWPGGDSIAVGKATSCLLSELEEINHNVSEELRDRLSIAVDPKLPAVERFICFIPELLAQCRPHETALESVAYLFGLGVVMITSATPGFWKG